MDGHWRGRLLLQHAPSVVIPGAGASIFFRISRTFIHIHNSSDVYIYFNIRNITPSNEGETCPIPAGQTPSLPIAARYSRSLFFGSMAAGPKNELLCIKGVAREMTEPSTHLSRIPPWLAAGGRSHIGTQSFLRPPPKERKKEGNQLQVRRRRRFAKPEPQQHARNPGFGYREVRSFGLETDGRTDRQLTHTAADRRPLLTVPRSGWPDAVAWKPSLPDAPWRRASALHLALHSTAGRTTAHVWGLFNCRPPAAWARSERAPSPPPSLRSVAGVPALWKVVGGESILHLALSVGLGRLEPPISIARRVVRPSAVQFEEFVCVGC